MTEVLPEPAPAPAATTTVVFDPQRASLAGVIVGGAIAVTAIISVAVLAVLGVVGGEAAYGGIMLLAGGGAVHAIKSS